MVHTAERGEWALVLAFFPDTSPEPIGVLVRDMGADRLYVKLRHDWWTAASDENGREIWPDLGEYFQEMARDMSSGHLLDWLETSASHVIQVSARAEMQAANFEATLDSLYKQHVCALEVERKPVLPMVSSGKTGFVARRASTVRALSRLSPGFSFHSRSVYAALAASAVIMTLPWGVERFVPTAQMSQQTIYEPSLLPVVFESSIRPVSFDLDSAVQRVRPVYRYTKKPRKPLFHTHKVFRPEGLLPQHRVLHIARIGLPALQIVNDVTPATSLRFGLPEAPQFRPRRNRFVRIISVLFSPFKGPGRVAPPVSETVSE
jgi:hypothetical protein